MDQTPTDHFGTAVRRRRAELGITMEQLATASGVSRGTLSRIETNALSTSLTNAVAIAVALGCDLSDLLAPSSAMLQRAGEALTYTDTDGIERTSLARPAPGIELVQFRIPPRATSTAFAAHAGRTTETVHVASGSVDYRVGDRQFELHAGDTLTARADETHSFHNRSNQACVIHMLISSPR